MATLVCTIQMEKAGGVSIVIDNDDDSVTQTIHLDGQKLTMTVKCKGDTSSYVQDAKSVTIKCDDFKVEAKTITCSSSKESKYESDDTLLLSSKRDMTIKSQADLKQSAVGEVSISGRKVSIKSQTELDMGGASAKMKSDGPAEMSGSTLKLSGLISAELSAPMVTVKADGILTLKGGIVRAN